MHEWALAEGIVSTALEVAEKSNAKKIIKIRIKIGELQQIDLEVFKFALQELIKDTKAEKADVTFNSEKVSLKCNSCGHEWNFSKTREYLTPEISESIHFIPEVIHSYARCPECGSPDFEIEEGRGTWIESIEVKE